MSIAPLTHLNCPKAPGGLISSPCFLNTQKVELEFFFVVVVFNVWVADSLLSEPPDSKESAWNVGDLGSIPGLGRSPAGGGHGNPLYYSS